MNFFPGNQKRVGIGQNNLSFPPKLSGGKGSEKRRTGSNTVEEAGVRTITGSGQGVQTLPFPARSNLGGGRVGILEQRLPDNISVEGVGVRAWHKSGQGVQPVTKPSCSFLAVAERVLGKTFL
jgi:hypothetical protein